MQIILCTIKCHTKEQLMIKPVVSGFFFYSHSMESLSAINLYGQLMTLMVFVRSTNDFYVFPEIFFDKGVNFLYIVSNNSNVLKTSRPTNGNSCQQLSELNFLGFCSGRKSHRLLPTCPRLHHSTLYFSGMGFHTISFLIPGNQK